MKRILLAVVVVLALGAGWWKLAQIRNQPPTVNFAKAVRETIESEVSTNAKVDPSESATARAETSGKVENILVKLSQQVQKDDVLVELDTGVLKKDLESFDAKMAGIRAQIAVINAGGRESDKATIRSNITRLEKDLQTARREYERDLADQSKGLVLRRDVEEKKKEMDRIDGDLKSNRDKLDTLVSLTDREPLLSQLKDLDVQKSQTQEHINRSTIKAPISGTVFQFDLKPGAYLNPGDAVATIGNLARVRVLVYVDEPDLARVHAGLPVTLTWDAKPGLSWSGTVDRLPTQIQALDSRHVGEVVCLIDNPHGDLLPFANVTARIRTEKAENVITIPKESIMRQGDETGVYVLTGDHLEWRKVTQGISNVTRSEVHELKEGDLVAKPTEGILPSNGLVVTSSLLP